MNNKIIYWISKLVLPGNLRIWFPIFLTFCTVITSVLLVRNSYRQTAIALEGTRVGNRAYLSVENIDFADVQISTPITLSLNIRNFGKTPAYKTITRCAAGVLGQIPDNAFTHVDSITPDTGFVVGPGSFLPISVRIDTISPIGIQKIAKGELVLYLLGNIAYRDVFGKPHFTHFLYTWNPRAKCPSSTVRFNDAN